MSSTMQSATVRSVRPKSRSQRWNEAAADAREAVSDALDLELELEAAIGERKRDEAVDCLDRLRDAMDRTHEAFGALESVQEEYRDWLDNMPESLQSSPTADLLQEIVDLDVSPYLSIEAAEGALAAMESLKDGESGEEIDCGFRDADGMVDECEGVTLPRGFGRD